MYIIKVDEIYLENIWFDENYIDLKLTTNKLGAMEFSSDIIGYYINIIENFFYNSEVMSEKIEKDV